MGVFVPRSVCKPTSDTPVAPPAAPRTLARTRSCEIRQGRLQPARVKRTSRSTTRDAFHLAKTFAPQCPFERSAPACSGAVALPPQPRCSTPLRPYGSFGDEGLGSRPRAPLPRDARFSEPRSRSLTSATKSTRGHTQRAVAPRPRVRLSPHYPPTSFDVGCVGHGGMLPYHQPASRDLHSAGFHRRLPLAWTEQITGRAARAKAKLEVVRPRVPLLWSGPGTWVTDATHH